METPPDEEWGGGGSQGEENDDTGGEAADTTEEVVTDAEESYVPDDVNWVEDIKPITDAKCGTCHGGAAALGGISLETWEATQLPSPLCGTGTVGESILLKIQEPILCGQIMPPVGYPALSDAEIKVFGDWVLLGMPYGPAPGMEAGEEAPEGSAGSGEEGSETSDEEAEDDVEDMNPLDEEDLEGEGAGDSSDVESGEAEESGEDVLDEGFEEEPADELEIAEAPEEIGFEQVHPILKQSCSGLVCHQYTGFAQEDAATAFQVVVDKDFANNMVDAILDGRMPVNWFGAQLCTGDPAVDTDPKCLSQVEQDLIIAWYDSYEYAQAVAAGEGVAAPSWPDVQATFTEVHPILEAGCAGGLCHSGGMANFDINGAYDTIVDKGLCNTILDQVQSGGMPAGQGCSGDPAVDAGNPGCLSQEEHDILESWVTGGPACPGPSS